MAGANHLVNRLTDDPADGFAGADPMADTTGLGPAAVAVPATFHDRSLEVTATVAAQQVDLGPWRGRWIWSAASAGAAVPFSRYDPRLSAGRACIRAAWFRHRFTLDAAVAPVVRVSADSRYRLWLDGRLVARGPAPVGGSYGMADPPDWWYEDVFRLDTTLDPGPHLLAVEVVAGPEDPTRFSRGVGALRCELQDVNGAVLVASGTTWQAIDAGAYTVGHNLTCITRSVDLRQWPTGWTGNPTACADWPAATVVADAGWALRPHAVPPLAECRVRPVAVTAAEPARRRLLGGAELCAGDGPATIAPGAPWQGRLVLPALLAGYLQLVAVGSPGTRLIIAAQELPGRDEGPFRTQELVLGEGAIAFESFGLFSARVLAVTIEFPPDAGPVLLRQVAVVASTQPVCLRGAFRCSDPRLEELWRVARWNLQLCLQEIHLDSPHHQEPLGDHGDYLIEAAMAHACFGPYALLRADVRRMAADLMQHDGALFHTTYALLLPDIVADLLRRDGDRDTAVAVLPAIRVTLRRALTWLGPTGLLSEAPNYMFVDWVHCRGSDYHHPPAAQGMGPLTAFCVRALRVTAGLERDLAADPVAARNWAVAADRLAEAFRRELVSADGRVCDGRAGLTAVEPGRWLPADGVDRVASKHGAILAVWSGILAGDDGRVALDHVLDEVSLPDPQPYFTHYLFAVLDDLGLFAARARPLLDRWLAELADDPHSLGEMWHRGDRSHAWGGTPLVQLSTRVLGVVVESADPPRALLRPHPLDLRWCAGTVPVGPVDLHLRWERHGEDFRLQWWADGPMTVRVDEAHLREQVGGVVMIEPNCGPASG